MVVNLAVADIIDYKLRWEQCLGKKHRNSQMEEKGNCQLRKHITLKLHICHIPHDLAYLGSRNMCWPTISDARISSLVTKGW